MQRIPDWLELWRELAEIQEEVWKAGGAKPREDVWIDRAKKFDKDVKRRWAKPDSSRNFITAQLQANPDWTALDIGGGTGAWTTLMAQHAHSVTVVEPSPAMIEVMKKNLAAIGANNVNIVQGKWPEAKVEKHDLTFCSHAMYGLSDFAGFVRSLEAATRKLCVLILRAPIPEDLQSMAAKHVWGQPFDSPDFQVAYNALLQMGIFANVIIEDSGLWDPWTSSSMEEAFTEMKRKLNLSNDTEHDEYLKKLLAEHLLFQDSRYVWPQGVRSALVYWRVGPQ
jgi:2-polyprenyl-3-methyl-5-hydroxy-6-metoxy-1,4-benzoquinol methylase